MCIKLVIYPEEVPICFAIIGKQFGRYHVTRGRALGDSCVRPISFKRIVLDYKLLSAVMYLRPLNVWA